MKSRGRLIIALSLILISVTIVGTASYAWFTMNDRVNAGMDIEAVASSNLVISDTPDGPYSTSVDLSDNGNVKSLVPCSTADCSTWFIPAVTEGISYETGAISATTPFTKLANTTGYVRAGTVYVKSEANESGTSYKKLYVSDITVKRGTEQSDITKSLRIGVVCGTKVLIFDYDSFTSSLETSAIASVDNITGYPTLVGVSSDIVGVNTALLASDIGSSPVRIDIYIWYEGQDSACTSHNSVKIEDVVVSVEFKAAN